MPEALKISFVSWLDSKNTQDEIPEQSCVKIIVTWETETRIELFYLDWVQYFYFWDMISRSLWSTSDKKHVYKTNWNSSEHTFFNGKKSHLMREYVAVPFSDVIGQETTDTSCN